MEADIAGDNSFAPFQEQIVCSMAVSGDGLCRFMKDGGRLRLQLIDPEQLKSSLNRDLGNGRRIVAGEVDASDRRHAYHIRPYRPGDGSFGWAGAVRIDASEFATFTCPSLPVPLEACLGSRRS